MNWKSWEFWLHGLIGAFIGGGAGGVTAGLTSIGLDPKHYNFGAGLGHTLELTGSVFFINGMVSSILYLKTSPLPTVEMK